MKTYLLKIQSFNVTTSIKVDLSPEEKELLDDISESLVKQKAQNIIYVEDL